MNEAARKTWQDKDQFEFAAKAAGYTKTAWVEDANGVERFQVFSEREMWLEWNPRDDDGDALRLAVCLAMKITTGVWNCHVNAGWIHIEEPYTGDQTTGAITAKSAMQATRRAIFRAAAEVGKLMQ